MRPSRCSAASCGCRSCCARSARWRAFIAAGAAPVVKAAAEFGVAHMLSSVCDPGLEGVAKAAPDALRMFQLYVRGDAAWVDDHVERAIANGYQRSVSPSIPPITAGASAISPSATSPAAAAAPRAANSRWRSTGARSSASRSEVHDSARHQGHRHRGGRQACARSRRGHHLRLQSRRPPARPRPRLDGCACRKSSRRWPAAPRSSSTAAFYRGSDIVKAIALGANLVGLGRMQCYGLAAAGQAGIVRMLEILEDEVDPLARPAWRHELRQARPVLSACGRAGQCAARVLGVPVMGSPAVPLLITRPLALSASRRWSRRRQATPRSRVRRGRPRVTLRGCAHRAAAAGARSMPGYR